jgi:hypothetical protein
MDNLSRSLKVPLLVVVVVDFTLSSVVAATGRSIGNNTMLDKIKILKTAD